MIGYTMVGTNDLEHSLRFYDPIFETMGLDECWRDGQSASWGRRDDESYPRFFTGYPFDGKQAGVGNGSMTAFLINDPRLIDRLHELALSNGGSDEGQPGYRPQYGKGFYGAYVRDPDGNKLAFVCYTAQVRSPPKTEIRTETVLRGGRAMPLAGRATVASGGYRG